MVTPLNLPRLRELLQAGTAGPWKTRYEQPGSHGGGDEWHVDSVPLECCVSCGLADGLEEGRPDADLIVSAVNALPALLAIAEAAERWKVASCSRLGGCDPYDCSHNDQCETIQADSGLLAAIDAARKAP